MSKIGIDLDICTVRSDLAWLRWLNEIERENTISLENLVTAYGYGEVPYDLSQVFTLPDGLRAIDFWKCEHLYDNLHPRVEAVEAIKTWNDQGHEIIFISSIKGFHSKSKFKFVERFFPYNAGVLFTKEKHLVNVDVMIEDRTDILEKFDPSVLTVQIPTPYKQFTDWKPQITMNWEMLPLILGEEFDKSKA